MLLATFPSQDPTVVIQRRHCSLLMKITHIHHVKRQLRSVPPLSEKRCTIHLIQHTHTKHLQNFSLVRLEFQMHSLHRAVNCAFLICQEIFFLSSEDAFRTSRQALRGSKPCRKWSTALSGIQHILHNFVLYFRQFNLMWGKTVRGEGEERKANFLLVGEPIFIPSVSTGPSQLTWVSCL